MNLRVTHEPGTHIVTDDETGEILIFALWGELQHVKLYELTRKMAGQPDQRRKFDDYA